MDFQERRPGLARLAFVLVAVLAGCEGLLDVENPASITDDDIRNESSAAVWANGAHRAVQQGWDGMLTTASTAADELHFVGAHTWWRELDQGHVANLRNTALNREFRWLASGQWMADEAVHVLDSLDTSGALKERDRPLLARAYLYGAIAYATLADWMEDYAPSDRTEPGPAIGPENMLALYDTAVEYATRGLAIEPNGELGRNLTAARARARHGRAVRSIIHPPPVNPGGGLVSDVDAVSDALETLAIDPGDWRYEFLFEAQVVTSSTAFEINCFDNLQFGDRYVNRTPDNSMAVEVTLLDPLDRVPDPWLESFIFSFQGTGPGCDLGSLTVFSAREMHLIVAEDALARGDLVTFTEHVNAVRAFGDLTPWTPDSGVTARDLLIYERQSQLFLTGRRLADLYRFGVGSDVWVPGSVALVAPGTLFPIPQNEIEANCHLNANVSC